MIRTLRLVPALLGCLVVGCGGSAAADGAAPAVGASGNASVGGSVASPDSGSAGVTLGGSTGSAEMAGNGAGGSLGGGDNAESGGVGGTESAGAGGSGGGGGMSPGNVPGQNFDLTQWALQLPVANGDSVVQIKDLSTYTSEYFFTGPDSAMTFWCPVTGGTTSHSHYPRSELRELPVGGDWDITGNHKLSAQLKMLQNPPSKGTVIGQVHGNATDGTSEVLKLEWMTDNSIVASVEANDTTQQANRPSDGQV